MISQTDFSSWRGERVEQKEVQGFIHFYMYITCNYFVYRVYGCANS